MADMSSEQKVYGKRGEGLKGEVDMVGMDHEKKRTGKQIPVEGGHVHEVSC